MFKEISLKRRKLYIEYVGLGILVSLLSIINVNCYQGILDAISSSTIPVVNIIVYAISLLGVYILNYICEAPSTKLSQGLYYDLKIFALKKISRISYIEYQKIGTGKLLQIIENGASSGKNIWFGFYCRLFREILPDVMFSVIFIALISVKIMLIISIGYIFVFIITNLILKSLYKIKMNVQYSEEKFNKYLTRGLMELVVFRINGYFKKEICRVNNMSNDIIQSQTKMVLIHEAFFAIFAVLIGFVKIVIICFSFFNIGLSVGELVSLLLLVDKAYNPIAIFNVLYVQKKLDEVSFERYKDILSLPEDLQIDYGEEITNLSGKIDIKNVELYYDSKQILNNFNLNITEGQSVALVGESGSGKTTIVKLILGLIKPKCGEILIDNHPLGKLKLEKLYSNVSYVSQDTPVFDGSIRENITFDKDVSDELIMEILHQVRLDQLISSLENGLDTEVGEKGVALSGGERQRLALARLFLDDSKIIILDEATSALDSITEEEVMENILRRMKDKTIITIAHRLNTIKSFEKIIVLKDAKVNSSGSFDELIASSMYFKELWNVSYQQEKNDEYFNIDT